jgi:sulfate transport system substrate-binding protein
MRTLVVLLSMAALACARTPDRHDVDLLTLGAYTAPREALAEALIPAFRRLWQAQTGRDVEVRASYLGSGAQARAVEDGFEADVVLLALESDVDRIARAGLLSPDWRKRTAHGGFVSRSLVVLAVRHGNPRLIHDWEDLARPGLEILTPNPKTSGGAMWNLLALYGAGLRHNDAESAAALVRGVVSNVVVMDKGARESIVSFERGIGDAAITYEQEVHVARRAGRLYDYVIPSSTIVIEIPAAVVDRYAALHGTSEVATAFVSFLGSPEGQRLLGEYGFRDVREDPHTSTDPRFPPVADPFRVLELGGWDTASKTLLGPAGKLTQVLEETEDRR